MLRVYEFPRNLYKDKMSSRFVQDVGILTIANFVGAALNLVQGILVARWLDPGLYGVVSLVMLCPGFVYAVIDARSGLAATKYFSEYHARSERNRALTICKLSYAADTAGACLAFAVVFATAQVAANTVIHDPQLAGLLIIYGASLLPRALVSTSHALLVALGHSSLIALIQVTISSIRAGLVICLVLGGWQVAGVVWGNAAASVLMGLLYAVSAWLLVRRAYGASILGGRFKSLKGEYREIFTFCAFNNLNAIMTIASEQLGAILLGYFRGPTEVGYYTLAKNLSGVVEYVKVPLFSVSFAQLARLWGLQQKQVFRRRTWELVLGFGLPFGLLILISAGFVPIVLPLIVGESYSPAIAATQILLIAAAVSIPFLWLRAVYLVRNLVQDFFFVNAVATVAFVCIGPFLIWKWGYIGAAGALLTLQLLGTGSCAAWLSRLTEKRDVEGGSNRDSILGHDDPQPQSATL